MNDFHTALAYYRGPLGTEVVALGFAALSGTTEADRAAARLSTMAQLLEPERDQVIAFANTEAARRLHAAYEERQAISRAWAVKNQPAIMSAATLAMATTLTEASRHPGLASGKPQ